jgi:hypothetical protein
LDADKPERIVGERIKRRANGQHGESNQKDRLAPHGVCVAADKNRDRQHHALDGDHAERHHRRRLLRELKRQLLPDQRQQRRVGEVEQHGAEGENHERWRLEQDPVSGRRAFGLAIGGEVSRPVMVDRLRRNGEHRRRRQGREDGNHQKDGALGKGVADRAGQESDDDVAAVVKGGVPTEPAGQLVFCDQAESEGRDRRSEGVAGDRQDAQRNRHWPESGSGEYDRRGRGHRRHRQEDDASLGAGDVDSGSNWGLKRDAEEAARGRHQPDIGLGPVLARDQEDVDERSEKVADIGGEEIDCVERIRDREHRRRPNASHPRAAPVNTARTSLFPGR